jgi:hypothetical protein
MLVSETVRPMSRSSFPRWFRFTLVGVFFVLVGAMLLLHNGGVREALASSLAERMIGRYAPVMRQTIAAPKVRPEPPDGKYVVNGMLVEYHTIPAPVGAAESLRRFDEGFRQTGYVTRMIDVMEQPTLAAIHPQTKMLLTVRPGFDAGGAPTVRLSQQDLSKLDPKFRAELPGVPVMAGARNRVLVRWVSGSAAASLTYTVHDGVDNVRAYYANALPGHGWRPSGPSSHPPLGQFEMLFFERDGDDCAVVAGPGESAGETIVMLTLTSGGRG